MSGNTKLRKSQRRKLRKKKKFLLIAKKAAISLMVIAFLLVLGFVLYFTLFLGYFNLTEIEVQGAEILTEEQIIEASGLHEGQNIFLLDLNNARYNINKVLSAKNVYIQTVLPNKVVISIDENDPIGVIIQDGKNYYLSQDGTLMEITDELGKDDTPIISGFDSYEFQSIGEEVVVEPEHKYLQILNILKLFEKSDLLNQLSEISLTKDNNYKIITKNGVVFTVKDMDNLQEYYDYITTVIENGEMNQDINLISGNNPIKKPR